MLISELQMIGGMSYLDPSNAEVWTLWMVTTAIAKTASLLGTTWTRRLFAARRPETARGRSISVLRFRDKGRAFIAGSVRQLRQLR